MPGHGHKGHRKHQHHPHGHHNGNCPSTRKRHGHHCKGRIQVPRAHRSFHVEPPLTGTTPSALPSAGQRFSGGDLHVDAERCKGCGKCLDVCPTGAVRMGRNAASVDERRCNGCGACTDACPTGAMAFVASLKPGP